MSKRSTRLAMLALALTAPCLSTLAVATPANAAHRVKVDTTPPSISWSTPTGGQAVSGTLNEANGNCVAAVSDNVGVHHVDFYADGVLLNTELSSPYSCVWDTSAVAAGTHTLKATALDAAGNSRSASIDITIASPAPAPSPAPTPPPAPSVTPISGTTYYVAAGGSDTNSGTSPSSAWRTVAKANSAAVNPGDGVLFEGGQTFSDQALTPKRSGTASNPVVYGSYGSGQARMQAGVYLNSVSGVAVQRLSISGVAQAILASGSGSGASNITIEANSITNASIAVNSASTADSNWTIRDNTISQTADSGMILYGSTFKITNNSITDTGSSITYGKHGIYLKVVGANVSGNTIRRFQANGISVRYRNSVLENNTISDGPIGIAWFQYDTVAGTSYWRDNTISATSSAGIYVSPSDVGGSTRESFTVTGNKLSKLAGVYMNLAPTSGTYSVSSNSML